MRNAKETYISLDYSKGSRYPYGTKLCLMVTGYHIKETWYYNVAIILYLCLQYNILSSEKENICPFRGGGGGGGGGTLGTDLDMLDLIWCYTDFS